MAVKINDIAKHAHVSAMSVSRYLNTPQKVSEKTKLKIITAMKELNYQPNKIAKSLAMNKSYIIGVIIPDIKNPFFSSCIHTIEGYMSYLNFNILLCNSEEDSQKESEYLDLLLTRKVDGVIIFPISSNSAIRLKKTKTPFVLVDRKFDDVETDYITVDHCSGALLAVEHLIKLGHKKIGFINGPGHLFPYAERNRGYRKALTQHNIQIDPRYIKECAPVQHAGYEVALEILKLPDPPTAFFLGNNLISVGAIKAAYDLNLNIPDDISIVAFDKLPSNDIIRPKITCISQPVEFIATNAAMLLIGKIEKTGFKNIQKVTLKPELIVGESCSSLDKVQLNLSSGSYYN
ncbi:MAG: LacI family transcriptional regulator [Calditrichaeota bacterium]|nr:MAG: LacI family transcriptional regulator [Calditrichota bacterium]